MPSVAGDQPREDEPTPQPAHADVRAVSIDIRSALAKAIACAGTLNLTVPESVALRAPFPQSAVRQRVTGRRSDDYLPHILISRRLTEVLAGEWAVVRLKEWIDVPCQRVYGSYVLIVRGCLVADTIQGWPYQASNRDSDYGDAIECCRGAALRRMAAKSCLGCGDQVWLDEAEGWEHGPQTPAQTATLRPIADPLNGHTAQQVRDSLIGLQSAAAQGTAALAKYWLEFPHTMRKNLATDKDRLKEYAAAQDRVMDGAGLPQ